MKAHPAPSPSNRQTPRQRCLRHRASGLSLHRAVRLAVHAFFHFTHRAERAAALWSRSEHVWLGKQTFLSWAMCDAAIDVPWLVADAADAPQTTDELHQAIRAELNSYWAEQLDCLPRKSTPRWLALP